MRTALANNSMVVASRDAPPLATCPVCGGKVELRRQAGEWYYRHLSGGGRECSLRAKPPQDKGRPTGTEVIGDPYLDIAARMIDDAIKAARRGDEKELLFLAFGQVAALALDVAGTTPEDVLRSIPTRASRPTVVVGDDEADILERFDVQPAPILDLRTYHNGHLDKLVRLSWYVRPPLGPAGLEILGLFLARLSRAYILGYEEWKQVNAVLNTSCSVEAIERRR